MTHSEVLAQNLLLDGVCEMAVFFAVFEVLVSDLKPGWLVKG